MKDEREAVSSSCSIRGGLPMSVFLMFGVPSTREVSSVIRRHSLRRCLSDSTQVEACQLSRVRFSKRRDDSFSNAKLVLQVCFHLIQSTIQSFLDFPFSSSFFISIQDRFLFSNSFVAKFFTAVDQSYRVLARRLQLLIVSSCWFWDNSRSLKQMARSFLLT